MPIVLARINTPNAWCCRTVNGRVVMGVHATCRGVEGVLHLPSRTFYVGVDSFRSRDSTAQALLEGMYRDDVCDAIVAPTLFDAAMVALSHEPTPRVQVMLKSMRDARVRAAFANLAHMMRCYEVHTYVVAPPHDDSTVRVA